MSRLPRLRSAMPAALLLTLAACSNSAEPAAPSDPAARVSTAFELPEERAYPEGIAVDSRTGDVYVGSWTTGAVYRATAGSGRAEVFLPSGTDGRMTANGLRVDSAGRLWVTDHTTGVAVYDTGTRALLARFDTAAADQPFINDLAVTPDGSVYITDSVRPMIYRVGPEQLAAAVANGGRGTLPVYADLSTAVGASAPGSYLLNGIVADEAGRYLLTVDMASGDLYRIALQSQPVITKVNLQGGNLINGDGLELHGDTLWAVHNKDNAVSRWRLTADGTAAELQHRITDEALRIPTTMAHSGDRVLVVVSQFDRGGPMGAGTPSNPFRVVAVDGI
ncbi:SMP-30/gluconolactonase/LRE family protein [Nocardia crassostreae]|uniref:SMP-30/gluconolactonase/LRE family protein n=1 Tax=Nocardia crassostreae TaxID=53428 RepID=UPI000836E632|nr:SMP-30/gluconolactonase/LRE family protein [Nocardia crassostreae]